MVKSAPTEIFCGVPQGSPILILIYVNDITTIVNLENFYQCADDTDHLKRGLTAISLIKNHSIMSTNYLIIFLTIL